jgi:hypothetical protein
METILSIAGLALSFASLVPSFTQKQQKQKILLISIGLSLIGIFLYQIWIVKDREGKVKRVENQMIEKLSVSKDMTFQQLFDELNFADFSIAEEAIDNLVDAGTVKQNPVEATLPSGKRSRVRIYNVATPK